MTINSKSMISKSGVYRIRDTTTLLWTILGVAILAVGSWFYHSMIIEAVIAGDSDLDLKLTIAATIDFLLVLTAFRLSAIWDGVKLDLQNRTIDFGGGGVEANDLSDYLKPSFLLQYFMRHRINLDDISQMQMDTQTTRAWNDSTKSWIENTTHFIRLQGRFGSASIPFASEGKCDQLYSAIREANRMGNPIFSA
jgi:hypothetical protein